LDSVFPTVDRDVDWGGEAADYIHSADEVADIWVPWGGRDFLANSPPKRPPFTDFEIKILTDAGASPTMHLQDKVVIGKPMAIAKVFKEIGLHIGDHEWRTDEFAEAMFWEALSKLGFAEAKVRVRFELVGWLRGLRIRALTYFAAPRLEHVTFTAGWAVHMDCRYSSQSQYREDINRHPHFRRRVLSLQLPQTEGQRKELGRIPGNADQEPQLVWVPLVQLYVQLQEGVPTSFFSPAKKEGAEADKPRHHQ
jgi:hypothetical protein